MSTFDDNWKMSWDAYQRNLELSNPQGRPAPPITLGQDIKTGESIRVSVEDRTYGTYVVGLQGRGKSNLITEMVEQDMRHGFGLCVLDPHGLLTEGILDRVPASREKDVIVLDVLRHPHITWGLNLFASSDPDDEYAIGESIDYVMQAFDKLFGDLSGTIGVATMLQNLAYLMLANHGTTMTDIPRVLDDDAYRRKLLRRMKNPDVRRFWNRYEDKTPAGQEKLSEATERRIGMLTVKPNIRNIVTQKQNSINFLEVMQQGKILLIQFSPKMEFETDTLGTIVVLQLLQAALSRSEIPPSEWRPFFIYADEFQRFASDSYGKFLQEARKYQVCLLMAHQMRTQLRGSVADVVLGALNLITFQVDARDGRELAERFDPPAPEPEIIGYKPKMVPSADPLGDIRKSQRANDPQIHTFLSWIDTIVRMEVKRQAEFGYERKDIADVVENEAGRFVADIVHGREPSTMYMRYFDEPSSQRILRSFGELLAKNPPLVQSHTETVPEYGPTPSSAKIKEQLKRQLVTPPKELKYTARCRTGEGEWTIRIPYHPTPPDEEKRQRIRQYSYHEYYFEIGEDDEPEEETPPQPPDEPLYDAPSGDWWDAPPPRSGA